MVVKGPHKGYVGTIKDTNGNIARVELQTGNKLVMIDKDWSLQSTAGDTTEAKGGFVHPCLLFVAVVGAKASGLGAGPS